MLWYASMTDAGTGKGASVTKAVPWNVISYLGRFSVPIVFGGVIGLAVNIVSRDISFALIIGVFVTGL
jgi:hypothetical protein